MAEKAEPEPKKDPGGYQALDAKVERVRDSAKWFVGAFAAVAALLIPGLQLSDVGALDGSRLAVALIAAFVGIAASGLAAILAAGFLRPVEPTLGELIEHEALEDDLGKYLRANRPLLRGEAKDLGELRDEYSRARNRVTAAEPAAETAAKSLNAAIAAHKPYKEVKAAKATNNEAQTELAAARGRCAVLEQIINQMQAVARFQRTRAQFQARTWDIAAAALVAAAAITTFAVAAHPPEKSRADFSDARIESIDLSGTNLEQADFDDAELIDVDLRDANLEGASFKDASFDAVDLRSADLDDADLDGAEFRRSQCPDGTQIASTGNTCAGHIYVPPDIDVTWYLPAEGQ